MAEALSAALVAHIRKRLDDDWRRTGDGDWQRTPREQRRQSEATTPLGEMMSALLDAHASELAANAPLDPLRPLDEKAVAKIERQLGFALPGDLRQLYRELADGGFGPFAGIRRLANWAKDYLKLCAGLEAERGHPWPSALLPLVFLNGRRICLDRETGAVVLWNRPPKRCSANKWAASFVPKAPDLAAWLQGWVDTPTWCEGGPEGGWTPSPEEAARREMVAKAAADREAKAAQRAARVSLGRFAPLADDLLHRIAEKAGHPHRRTAGAEALEGAQPVDLATLLGTLASSQAVAPETSDGLAKMAERMQGLQAMLGLGALKAAALGPGMVLGVAGTEGALGRPATATAIAAAERTLGFALPAPLRQLYDLADGGFGPAQAGIMPLAQVVATYRRCLAAPQGPNNEPWSARLLPLTAEGPQVWCFDLEDGTIVCHDLEAMDHLGFGQWQRSFRIEAASLGDWLEAWLQEQPLAYGHADSGGRRGAA